MTYSQFLQRITSDTQFLEPSAIEYAKYHSTRLYTTWVHCMKYLKPGQKVLSIGAGIASIEKMLAEKGMEVTVVDFAETVDAFSGYYSQLGFKSCKGNFYSDQLDLEGSYFDMLLCSEVVEHIPLDPYLQLQNVMKYLKPKAVVVVTTPNLGSILHITKLLFMKPILEAPAMTFGEVNMKNQAVHRREYLPSEIHQSYISAGFEPVKTKYFYYTHRLNLSQLILKFFGAIVPRFRPGMLLIGIRK